jgi:hypothetical protein
VFLANLLKQKLRDLKTSNIESQNKKLKPLAKTPEVFW